MISFSLLQQDLSFFFLGGFREASDLLFNFAIDLNGVEAKWHRVYMFCYDFPFTALLLLGLIQESLSIC